MWFCEACRQSLTPLGVACPRCSEPQEGATGVRCRRCRHEPLPLDLVAPWRYGGALQDALRAVKFAGRLDAARAVARLCRPYLDLAMTLACVDVVVPVPLHWRRRAKRGFDQAAVMARWALADEKRPCLIADGLMRQRSTPEQVSLPRSARLENMKDAFNVPARRRARVEGRTVLLFDDVITTGATMAAAGRALLAAGAAQVIGFGLARAEP